MGLSQSRVVPLPSDIDDKLDGCREKWTAFHVGQDLLNLPTPGQATMPQDVLERAAYHIANYFSTIGHSPKILEPFAGNGVASSYVFSQLRSKFVDIITKSTDVMEGCRTVYDVEFGINALDTVEKYVNDGFDTLMMISPPPGKLYGDLFAVKAWSRVPSAKFLIFVGELGASDGSEGMYDYLLNHSEKSGWRVVKRERIFTGVDILGGPCEKEVFIFERA
jgi:hypothetical protein